MNDWIKVKVPSFICFLSLLHVGFCFLSWGGFTVSLAMRELTIIFQDHAILSWGAGISMPILSHWHQLILSQPFYIFHILCISGVAFSRSRFFLDYFFHAHIPISKMSLNLIFCPVLFPPNVYFLFLALSHLLFSCYSFFQVTKEQLPELLGNISILVFLEVSFSALSL